jgi:heme/copper-type cytochrome/quinol oxidase subunit 1
LLPAVGIISTIIAAAHRRPLAGERFARWAVAAIGLLSFGGWLTHMTTSGVPPVFLALASAPQLLTVIPAGVLLACWITTMAGNQAEISTQLLFALASILLLVVGGVSGAMLAFVPFDQQMHNTYFVVGYLHLILFGAVIFPALAGLYAWLPQVTGRLPNQRIGFLNVGFLTAGTFLSFIPMYILGLMGMRRGIYTYPVDSGWGLSNVLASAGAYVMGLGALTFLADIAWSFVWGERVPAALTAEFSEPAADWNSIPVNRGRHAAAIPARSTQSPRKGGGKDGADAGTSILPLSLAIGLGMVASGLVFWLPALFLIGGAISVGVMVAWLLKFVYPDDALVTHL